MLVIDEHRCGEGAALDRLRTTGFYIGDFFANHGPMAAEALAKLGYCDEVEGWVDANIAHRDHGPLPKPSEPIGDWRVALGDRNRGGDWLQLFRHELAEAAWRDVLHPQAELRHPLRPAISCRDTGTDHSGISR
jgi:hypothetical protein